MPKPLGRLRATLALWLLLMLPPGPAEAQGLEFGQGPVLVFADRLEYDVERQVVTATGNVEIIRGTRSLRADLLRYDQKADRIEAVGNVVLREPTGQAIFADRVTLSGDLKNGVIEQLRARMVGNERIAAARGRRIDGTRSELDRAVYSPCPLCPDSDRPPLWQISAERVLHDETTRDITYRNAFLEIAGVPVFYTPYFSHPDPTVDRRSGFLAPSFGNDSELGLMLQTPYYFALAPNYDVTLAPIVFSNEGPVLTAEYRHLLPSGRFDLAGSATYGTEAVENLNDVPEGDEFRGHIEGQGRFRLDDPWRWGYDLAAATDDTYLERYDFSDEDVLTSRLFTERIWGRNYAAINGYGFQGLRPTDSQGEIPFALPWAQVDLTSAPLFWGSRATLDSSILALTRTDGLDTRRLSASGGWELPWWGAVGDLYRLRLGLRGDFYQLDGNPQTFEDNGTASQARLVPEAVLDWRWPWIADGYPLTPVIEPVASLTFIPEGSDKEDIPNEDSQDLELDDTNLFEASRFPGLDRVEEGARLNYGLRFGAFGDRGELISGLFGQSFRFGDDSNLPASSGLDGTLSDYVGRLDFNPSRWLSVRYRFRLDQDSLGLLRNEIGALVGPPRARFDVVYLSLEDDPASDRFREREEVRAGITVGVTQALSVRARIRRNLAVDENISQQFAFIYRHPCLQLIGGVERRFTRNRDADDVTTFTLRVTFQNLGELGLDRVGFGS